ncbi:FUSC family protein [Autumnicola psychrophila]|uniref:FUSC family membrane protein n=1 Tax=Autumnicola psychrophila TaxID=3075592 RepID=A0ABU3DPX8_9FLAO|nr:FUSC family membrane protein [Zunongwangia sp. F225]MDT0685774.1 FUSC family membrane protein [Zunongwangia sp. F225]
MKIFISNFLKDLLKFLRSTDFSKAIVLTVAIIIPIALFSYYSNTLVGVVIASGCLLSSPSDVAGSFKHKVIGVSCAAILAGLSSVISGYAQVSLYLIIPVLGMLMFAISYLAVFGFRASLITFSGLLAVVISFANLSKDLEIWQRGILIILGGFWYLSLSLLWDFLNPRKQTEHLLAGTMELTAKYLRIRAKLYTEFEQRDQLLKKLFLLQTELNEKHESLREVLISSRKTSGNSNYARKRLLIFIELVDMLELAMANPVDYSKMDELLGQEQQQFENIQDLLNAMAEHLEQIASALKYNNKLPPNNLKNALDKLQSGLLAFREKININESRETMLLLRNLIDYQEQQVQRMNSIFRILNNLESEKNLFIKSKEVSRFITPQDYDPKILVENFNFNSIIFRHSIRLAVVVIIGFSIGIFFSIQNAYWIILTIAVIMRPNYGLTKDRSKQRIIGTLIGGAIAVGIVYITQNEIVYMVLGIGSLTLAFSLLQRNYRTAAIFITLSIIFIYALLQPNVLNVIQYRIVDTLIGAGLAALGNHFLWPSWEVHGIKSYIQESIAANRNYLEEVDNFYHNKGKLPISYKLARKKSFLEMGNLSAAFQRMTQEPKSKQKDISRIYEIVGLNQTFLSALASLGTYIQNHETTAASVNFETFTNFISENLKSSEDILQNNNLTEVSKLSSEIEGAAMALKKTYEDLVEKRTIEIEEGKQNIDLRMRLQLQEAQLVNNQLRWLADISTNIRKTVSISKEVLQISKI